ncbi:MAG TPA: molybdopterin cofactor-binding domain-containing protein [Casimicrobiaceae bacterium]|nr:molybdopterin cofactor-binding domain-containing protein [Casimicrobiaceae bacterium]
MTISRRDFLKVSSAAGGGLALQFSFPLASNAAGGASATEVNAWIVIHPDDRVVIRIARSEMGQGSYTALAQLVAEELDCDWSKVSAEFASPNEHFRRNRVWGSMSTGGSQGIRSSQGYLRKAGATAREMLVGAAAARWKVDASQCTAASGVITHASSGRSLRYGQVAAAAASVTPPTDVTLRDPGQWKIAGKPVHRLDIPDKVRGKPVYAVDVTLPGMLHASIAQCPVFGGKVKDVDPSAALAMRGVKKVVREDDFVAVVADNWWRANQALKQVKIDWDSAGHEHVDNQAIATMFREGLAAADLPQARKMGDAPAALASAAKVVEAEYQSPYLNHATMEPQTCTAWFKPNGTLEVWTSTQNGEASMTAAADVSGLPLEKIEVHKMMCGGGFGRRGAPQDFVRQGVAIAKAMPGVPVKMIWSREEDMQHGFYRPASLVRIKAGLDAQGKVTAMHTTIACPSIQSVFARNAPSRNAIDGPAVRSFSDMPYGVPHQRVDYAMRNGHVPVGYWRAPGQQNSYYRECFIDELAAVAGKDPVEFRRAMLDPADKNRRVLEAVAKAANWSAPLRAGLYRGVAVADGFGSYTALVAELALTPAGEVKVKRVVIAIDSGYVVNPDTCRAQAESNVVYGLGSILYQENNVKDGRIVESNFHDFRLPRIDEIPQVETVLVPSGGFWGGHGEPAILGLAPAVCNALFAATGKRIRSLPLKQHDLTPI